MRRTGQPPGARVRSLRSLARCAASVLGASAPAAHQSRGRGDAHLGSPVADVSAGLKRILEAGGADEARAGHPGKAAVWWRLQALGDPWLGVPRRSLCWLLP